MTEPGPPRPARGRRARVVVALVVVALVLIAGACVATPTASPTPTPSATPSRAPSQPSSASPSPTPEPALSLDLPTETDPRRVRVTVDPQVPAGGDGQIVVSVANLSDARVTELVLRWATDLRETLFLAPFAPSAARIADGGPPLVQPWTKWVEGPGERGEPAGTTSLGWGPLDPGATLTIPILVTRRAAGDVAFDLQVLAGEAILTAEDGTPTELRVSVP